VYMHGCDDSGPWLGYRFVGIGGIPAVGTEKGKFPTFQVGHQEQILIKARKVVMKDVLAVSRIPGASEVIICVGSLPDIH